MNSSLSQFLSGPDRTASFWEGAALYERCLAGNEETLQQADALYAYGYEFLGMAYTVYIHRVLEKVRQYGIDHVVFVAREGYLFKKIYEVLTHHAPTVVGADVTTTYAYLSRMSTLLASVPRLTTRELFLANYKAVAPSGLGSIMTYVGLPPEAFVPLAEKHGLDLNKYTPKYWDDPTLLAFLNDVSVQSLVRHYHQQSKDNLQSYLEQCHFFGENRKVALVDIGWDGTIQDNLVRAFGHLPTFPLVHGLYFARHEFKGFLKFSSSFSNGLMFDDRELTVHEKSLKNCVELFEKGAGAPHASARGYERNHDGTVRPVFKSAQSPSRQEEIAANASIAVMQQGILDFAHQYAQQFKAQSFSAESVLPFTRGLITRHMAFPTAHEAHQVAYHLGSHSKDMGDDGLRILVMNPDKFWRALKSGKLKNAKKAFRFATWKAASLALSGIPGARFLYSVRRYLSS